MVVAVGEARTISSAKLLANAESEVPPPADFLLPPLTERIDDLDLARADDEASEYGQARTVRRNKGRTDGGLAVTSRQCGGSERHTAFAIPADRKSVV